MQSFNAIFFLFCSGQLHHLTHAGLAGRVNESRQPGGLNWGPYHEDDNKFANRDPVSTAMFSYLDFIFFFSVE